MNPERIHVFINFEGVLVKRGGAVVALLNAADDWHEFWCWAPPLIELAEQFDVALIIRSSWMLQMSFEHIIHVMPKKLAVRVVGAADPIAELRFSGARRIAAQYEVVDRYVSKYGLRRWCVVDDRDEGWPDEQRWRLVLCDDTLGLGDGEARATLAGTLKTLKDAP